MARKYYCHTCGSKLGLIRDPPHGKIIRTAQQYTSHLKHTVPDSRFSIQSVFADPSTSAYAGHLVSAMLAGAVEVDEQGRTNIIFAAGRQTGFRYEFGQLIQPSDAVKVVQSSNSGLVHAFPENRYRASARAFVSSAESRSSIDGVTKWRPNIRMEPTRPRSCVIMSPRRAAHSAR